MGMVIEPRSSFKGELRLPGDKSISHRAIMIGAIASGMTRIKNLLDCDDCDFTVRALKDMGIAISKRGGIALVRGKGPGGLNAPGHPISLGNSGTSMRLLAGILAGQPFDAVLTGDGALLKRPMRRIVEPLKEMGADIWAEDNEHPPIHIKGARHLKPITYSMKLASAQVKSAILFAGLYGDGTTAVKERVATRDHTERMLRFFGADIAAKGKSVFLKGPARLMARDLEVPSDISSAAFFMVGATILPKSRIVIRNVSINPTRSGVIAVLKGMGSRIRVTKKKEVYEPVGDIVVESSRTRGITIDSGMIPAIIDEIPILAVLAALSKGRTVFRDIGELKVKETDRVASIVSNLRNMGADINVEGEDIVINGVKGLKAAGLKSYGDHRTAMAMTIAALAASGQSGLDDPDCAAKSFPQFFDYLESIGRY